MNEISALQKVRASYQPKLPSVLLNGINNVSASLGAPTEAVRDKESIKELFKNLYGMPVVTFEQGALKTSSARNVGVPEANQ